jgi:DNA-binding transcriptional ArsR family regulator
MRNDEEAIQIDVELRAIAAQRQQLHVREARLLVRAEELEIWIDHGCATFLEYLERFCDLSPRTAREHLRVARALRELPITSAQLDAERIVYSTARELTRVATPETEERWLLHVAGMSPREIEDEVSGHKKGDLPTDPEAPDRMVKLVLEVRASTVAKYFEARTRYADEHGGDRPTDDELLDELCRPATSDDDSTRAPYQMAITTCRSCAKSFQLGGGREIEVPAAMVERARCDARFLGDLEADTPPRTYAAVTPRMRRQVIMRDGFKCSVPGCRSARHLDVHHLEYQSHGGPNKTSNLSAVCAAHHRQLHEGRLAMSGTAPHAVVFTWCDEPARTSTREAAPCPLSQNAGQRREVTFEEVARAAQAAFDAPRRR